MIAVVSQILACIALSMAIASMLRPPRVKVYVRTCNCGDDDGDDGDGDELDVEPITRGRESAEETARFN